MLSLSNTAQDLGLVAVISGGVLLALLALLVVVIGVISCWCIKKRKQVNEMNQQRL